VPQALQNFAASEFCQSQLGHRMTSYVAPRYCNLSQWFSAAPT